MSQGGRLPASTRKRRMIHSYWNALEGWFCDGNNRQEFGDSLDHLISKA
jgi:hypothetical protein